jgi:hypothetical protein
LPVALLPVLPCLAPLPHFYNFPQGRQNLIDLFPLWNSCTK